MVFKPNFNQQRAERNRAKQAKQQAKREQQEEQTAKRKKAAEDAAAGISPSAAPEADAAKDPSDAA